MTQKTVMLVMADAKQNHNKFYHVSLAANDEVLVRYGRVDGAEQRASKGFGLAEFERVVRAKKAKGYREVDVVLQGQDGMVQRSLSEVAKRDIVGNDPVLSELIEKLARINRHQLLAASGGSLVLDNGIVRTPVGLVTQENVSSAKKTLAELKALAEQQRCNSDRFLEKLNDYLTLIPQKVPHQRGWGPTFFDTFSSFQKQSDLLEQLEASISTALSAPASESKHGYEDKRLFAYHVSAMEDAKKFREIEAFYKKHANAKHVSSRLKLKRVYTLQNPEAEALFDAKSKHIGNLMRLWHGTRASNLLSIFKSGLIIPKSSGGNFTISGRMFGDGLYFSDQSTKSLNYSYGYWGHGPSESNCFMFLCDVAMGKPYVPDRSGNAKKPGFDSCFAKAGQSGVLNNEMIVYDVQQACLRYLCEFDS